MNLQYEKIRDVQREAWNKSSAGWKKWDGMMMQFLSAITDCMMDMVKLEDGFQVLDIATGTGEPGLTIASLVPHGKVIGTDLSQEMLKVAGENANRKGIINFSTVVCDAAEMPFENNSFDVVVCRHGFMFFADMDLALQEMMRVLKPGGSLVASVWNIPERNSWICDSMKTMVAMLNLNPPSPDAPGIFRCTVPGMMSQLLYNGGLKEIEERIVPGFLPCESFDQYWEFITEVASPVAFRNADQDMKERIRQELYQKVMNRQQDGHLMLEASSIVIAGIKK